MRAPGLVFVAVASGVLAVAAGRAQSSPTASAPVVSNEPVERGRQLYMTAGCWACHGYTGRGGIGPMSGPDLAGNPMPLDGFTTIVRHPVRLMPPFTDRVLSDTQVADIHQFLTDQPKSRRADDIPLLSGKK